jgi:hypothetical protein
MSDPRDRSQSTPDKVVKELDPTKLGRYAPVATRRASAPVLQSVMGSHRYVPRAKANTLSELEAPALETEKVVLEPEKAVLGYDYREYVQKFGSKTANLYEIERLKVKVPERSPVSSEEVFEHLLSEDYDGVISKSWEAMKKNGKIDDKNLKAITEKIEEIFNDSEFPFTKEQLQWINETMAGKVIIARSTGDEDSADTPNAGGNESVLFVEPNPASVQEAMKEVVLSYFGADSLRNRIVGDGERTVLSGLPKMPVLLMEMVSEPIKDARTVDKGEPPPIGIAMSTDKLEFTGGEDFHFVSVSSAVGPGVNEGSGRVEVDETFVMQAKDGTPLIIYQQPAIKLERIRAVKDDSGAITNQLEKNSTQIAYKPSLSREQVKSLVGSSDKIKSLNKGKTTEVEAVVGGDGQINFVQHRAIPDPRSEVTPTYVDTSKATGHSQAFQYTTVVPKSGDALVITDWSQVCFAQTMKEAEAMFDWKGGSQRVVIVRQPDGSNSHPAVNFGSYKKDDNGRKVPNPIPCLVVPNYEELLALKKASLAPDQPLIIDGQTQKAFVWTDKTFDPGTAIVDGRISHHLGLETSVTKDTVLDLVNKLKTVESDKLATLEEGLKPILAEYNEALKGYETLLTKNADTIHNSEGLKLQLQTIRDNFKEVSQALEKVVAGDPKYTFDEGTHARLLIAKFFEASMHNIDHFQDSIDTERSASRYLQAAKGSPIDRPIFADEVRAVSDGLTGPLNLRWKRFLTLTEQAGLSESEIDSFKGMMANLDKLGVTATWMSTVFDKKYAEIMPSGRTGTTPVAPTAKALLQALVKDYEGTSDFLVQQQSLQKKLEEAERSVTDFATPSKFEKAFGSLKDIAQVFIDEPWPKDLNDNPLKKAVQVQTLGRLIEVYDSSIKSLKNSSLPAKELVETEIKMLNTFSELFENLFTKIDLPSDNPKTKPKYLNDLRQAATTIKDQVKTMDEVGLQGQSRCGPDFNVNNCLYRSTGKLMPSNVEELFTTLHQGLEEIRSGLMVGGTDYGIDMPSEMQSLLTAIPRLAMQTAVKTPGVLVGRDITATGVTYAYNMPVLDHGIKIRAMYEKPGPGETNGKMSIELDFYADNAGDRLKNMAALANQFSFGTEPLDDRSRREVVWGEKQFKAKFELRSEMDIRRVTTLINNLNAYSMAPRNDSIHNITSLPYVVKMHNNLTSGVFPEKRRRILNDYLNVTFGTVLGAVQPNGKIASTTTDYNVKLVPSSPLSFVNPDDGQTYTLDFDKPKFGLTEQVFSKIPEKTLNEAKEAVLHGTRQFTFDSNGKSYTLDLNQKDLGLSASDSRALSLNGKRLGELRDELSLAWDNATFYLKGKDVTQFRSNWTDFMYGTPMSFSAKGAFPELDLWKAISVKRKKRVDLGKIDNSFKSVLEKKYALHDVEKNLAERASFATPKDKQDHAQTLQAYHMELSKMELICSGYVNKKKASGKYSATNSHGKVDDLMEQTKIQKKSIEHQMLILGLVPAKLSEKSIAALPFRPPYK